MGGLAKYMPITAVTAWIGALSLIGTPFFSGFYSKDTIIEAVGASQRFGARYAYYCVLGGRVHHRALHLSHALPHIPWAGALPRSRAP